MRKRGEQASFGAFELRMTGDGALWFALPAVLMRRLGFRVGDRVKMNVNRSGELVVSSPGVSDLGRNELYRVSAGWPQMRRALRRPLPSSGCPPRSM